MNIYRAIFLSFLIATAFVFSFPGPAFSKQFPDCLLCHKRKTDAKVVHPIIKESGCVACHTRPHEMEAKPQKFLFATGVDLCFTCHDRKKFTRKIQHPPVAQGMCLSCHYVHKSDNPNLLITATPGLCFNCHDKEKFEKKSTHPPVAGGMCTSCHNPHSSNIEKLLVSKPPDLCFICHEKDLYISDTKKKHHAPVLKGKCLSCHNPHASAAEKLLLKSVPGICFTCHIQAEFEDKYEHPPVEAGMCLSCHEPHQGDAKNSSSPIYQRSVLTATTRESSTGRTSIPLFQRECARSVTNPMRHRIRLCSGFRRPTAVCSATRR